MLTAAADASPALLGSMYLPFYETESSLHKRKFLNTKFSKFLHFAKQTAQPLIKQIVRNGFAHKAINSTQKSSTQNMREEIYAFFVYWAKDIF